MILIRCWSLLPSQDFRIDLWGALSGGMKQKLGMACALLGNPEFLVLDEPSVGVDPISRRYLIELLCKRKREKNGMEGSEGTPVNNSSNCGYLQ